MTRSCGCSTATCGCCEGTHPVTPLPTFNRPGLDRLDYRVGVHGAFLETMNARLSQITVDAPGADGQTIETFRPLQGLTTRDPGDPSIALLDAWATVGDVLTFYQERIANEGYLPTATERRSVLELARLVGYDLRPGVASTVFLAYTLEDKQADPVVIPAGARSQSIPGPDELPQSFETSEPLLTQAEWNNLQVRQTRPPAITYTASWTLSQLVLAGTDTNLKKADPLLFVFDGKDQRFLVRTVLTVEAQFEAKRTVVHLQPLPVAALECAGVLGELIARFEEIDTDLSNDFAQVGRALYDDVSLGLPSPPNIWADVLSKTAGGEMPQNIAKLIEVFREQIDGILKHASQQTPAPPHTSPSQFVERLLTRPAVQARSGVSLTRSLSAAFGAESDSNAQLLVSLAPGLKDAYYKAWSTAALSDAVSELTGVFALRVQAPLFGASVPKMATSEGPQIPATVISPPDQWQEWELEDDETPTGLFLDQAYPTIFGETFAIVQRPGPGLTRRSVERIVSAESGPRSGYGISGNTTHLEFERAWWNASARVDMPTLRRTLVFAQSEALPLADVPIAGDVAPLDAAVRNELELDALYKGLPSGRWVILQGERTDIAGVTGVTGTELMMIAGLRQTFDPAVPGDTVHTTLVLATAPAFSYKRDGLVIYGNVVKATHGETRLETLGSGDASAPFQAFALKQPPVTYVPAATPAGVESTLQVYVNDVQWHEAETLAGLAPSDRRFVTLTDDDDKTTVTFGNGIQGARLPTGVENVRSVYRNGIGQPGNVRAGQISLLQTRPLGVKEVINPLRASGGADRDTRDQARENAPLAVMALDRLVSVRDYADFTRTFAGIGKAAAMRFSDGRRQIVHVTIAGAADGPLDETSDLYLNLTAALGRFGDPALPVRVGVRELMVLILGAGIRLESGYLWDPVSTAVRAALVETFGFERRSFGQPALLCEAIATIQAVPGVAYVDVDTFGGVAERRVDANGQRVLRTPAEFAAAIAALVADTASQPAERVDANVAGLEGGTIRPAQVAIFTSAVPDTIVLNQLT